ncbi:MAG: hypothetical protein AB1Z20_19780 [Desulfobacterales bacterium]
MERAFLHESKSLCTRFDDELGFLSNSKSQSGPWKTGQRHFSGMTLKQFYDEAQIDLSVVASDTSEGRLLVLNHHTATDCPLVWAVRMSMSAYFDHPPALRPIPRGMEAVASEKVKKVADRITLKLLGF